MRNGPPETETLDITGQVCPASLLISLRRLNLDKEEIRAGNKILTVLTDNRDSVGTITDAVENMGFRVEVRKEEGHYALVVSSPAGGGA